MQLRHQLESSFMGSVNSVEEIVDATDLDLDGKITSFELMVGLTKLIHKSNWHTSLLSYIDVCAGS